MTSNLIFLVLCLGAAASALWACLAKSRALASALFFLALACTAALYFIQDAFFPALAHIVLFGGVGLLFLMPAAGPVRPTRRALVISAVASALLLTLLLAALFAGRPEAGFGWDRDGFASIPVLGDSMAVSWIVPLVLASLMVVSILAGASMLAKRRKE